jgi:hypothetical protein
MQREKVTKKNVPTEKMTGALAMEYCGCILLFHRKIIKAIIIHIL